MRKFTFKIKFFVSIAVLVFGSMQLFAQDDHVVVLTGDDNLHDAIMGDTLEDGARRDPMAIYQLKRGDVFRVSETLFLDFELTLSGEEGDGLPAFIMPRRNENQELPENYFTIQGDGLTTIIENVIMQGIPQDYEHMVTGTIMGGAVNEIGDSCRLYLNNVVFNGFSGIVVGDDSQGGYSKVTNCTFRNLGANKNEWSGTAFGHWVAKGIMDTLIIQNNTFINVGNSVVATEDLYKYVLFEHNTVFGTKIHWAELWIQPNLLMKDNMLYGCHNMGTEYNWVPPNWPERVAERVIGIDSVRGTNLELMETELGMTEADRIYNWKNNLIGWPDKMLAQFDTWTTEVEGFLRPAYTTSYHQKIIDDHPLVIEEGSITDLDPGFDQATIDRYFDVFIDWADNKKQTEEWQGYFPLIDNEGKYFQLEWPLPENLAYTNGDLATASTEGLHIGDLNWFPEDKKIWEGGGTGLEPGEITDFALSSYPNPFVSTTTIEYAIHHSSTVTLSIIDILGKEVAVLVDQAQEPGSYRVNWDGSELAGGIYFYQLRSASQTTTRRMIMIK